MPARALLGCLVLAAYSVPAAQGHTWMFTKGRAWMQASLDKPFRQRILEGGQGTHAQLGPGQSMVVRWATSHNNTFKLAVVAGKDQDWFYHKDFFAMFHDYIDSAPPGANEAVQKPRYHGAAGKSGYTNHDTYTACAGGYCVNNLFSRQLPTTDPAYISHTLDMGVEAGAKWTHAQYEYNPDIIHNEGAGTWDKIPDRRVSYKSDKYPWLVAAYRFHNKVNMHSDWDLVNVDLPARVYTDQHIAEKGQHYIVQFSSGSPTDQVYHDAIDVNIVKQVVDPDLIYGDTSGKWGWTKTDHCQFTGPDDIASEIRDATDNVLQCKADMSRTYVASSGALYGINVVPAVNPDVVPNLITRNIESVNPACLAGCTPNPLDPDTSTAGFCRLGTADVNIAVCAAPAKIHHVAWANPLVSNIQFDSSTVIDARPGDHIAFEWDDVLHDVWLMPPDAADPCDTSTAGAVQLIPPSHHATIDQNTEDTVVPGRNRYLIPAGAAGGNLLFVCTINGHCDAGMQLSVAVGAEPAAPDPSATEGVCPDDYILCEDQSKQTGTTSTVESKVNIPFQKNIGAESLRLSGTATRASTPWDNWTYRSIVGKRCRWRRQNTMTNKNPAYGGVDSGNRAVWDFPDHTLREVLEACSTSHPDLCTGISWKDGGGGVVNHTEANPATTVREYSSAQRTSSRLGQSPGWVVPGGASGQWMQLDMGEERKVNGIVMQARGNNCCGPMGVTQYTVKHSMDGVSFVDVAGVLYGPSDDWMASSWATDMHAKFKAFFPQEVTARYIRIYPTKWVGMMVMRAEVLYHLETRDITVGKHVFRRCMETGDFTRLVKVGSLTEDESRSFTVPTDFKKSVDCPGCYQCREVPLAPNYGNGGAHHQAYTTYHNSRRGGFNKVVTNAGTASAKLTINLRETVSWFDQRLSWEHHNPEFICRINPDAARIDPDLEDDAAWTTLLLPTDTSSPDVVIDAIAAGFQIPEAMVDFKSLDQVNLAAVFPPGDTVDPLVAQGPYYFKNGRNHTLPFHDYKLPARTLDGSRGGGFWPPKPVLKVSFMPVVEAGVNFNRLYPYGKNDQEAAALIEDTKALGWYVDQGAAKTEHTNSVSGDKVTFGWRCKPVMSWYNFNWGEYGRGPYQIIPPYSYGAARFVGKHFSEATGTEMDKCPDGRINAWVAEVPNGVYTLTTYYTNPYYQARGCTFNNVWAKLQESGFSTQVHTVEVADGRFVLSAGPPGKCNSVAWLKLDLVSTEVFPEPWLPAPAKEWWQLELDEPEADIGMVRIRLPHESYIEASHYPQSQDWFFSDCRHWWLYSPAKCYRMFMRAVKPGVHPEMVSYPNFPGFSQPFLGWLFDQHDTNSDGELNYEEYRAAAAARSASRDPSKPEFEMWSSYADDNAAHLWNKLDSFHVGYADPTRTSLGSGDGIVTRAEFMNGILSMPLSTFCEYFENTAGTHGSNFFETSGRCQKTVGELAEPFGFFPDDGEHGFVVTVSDIPCTDQDGCPTPTNNENTTVCEHRLYRTSVNPAQVDCGGARGKYVQISLPGSANRVLPIATHVDVHRSSVPLNLDPGTTVEQAIASTNPKLKTVCYGVKPRKVPAANDPDLLANAKLHPKTIVKDNPEDPIFWSTCYDRVVIKDWLPLESELAAREDDSSELVYSFNGGKQCLACDSLRDNHLTEYNMTIMPTPRWWLQPEGTCVDCNRELFPGRYTSAGAAKASQSEDAPLATASIVSIGAGGAVLVIAAVAVGLCFCRNRNKKKRKVAPVLGEDGKIFDAKQKGHRHTHNQSTESETSQNSRSNSSSGLAREAM